MVVIDNAPLPKLAALMPSAPPLTAAAWIVRSVANGQRDNAGLYLAVGRGSADVEHHLLGRTFKGGEDDFDAVSVGGYWTHFGQNNWYLDGVVHGTWYDMDMTGRRGLRTGETNGFGFAASLEGGYPFHFGDGWLIEPQAQLVYQNLNIDDFNDGAADVRYSDTNSLAGRIGARVARDWDAGDDPKRKFTLWLRADLWHEFLGDPTTEFSSATGSIPFTAELGDSWATLGVGAAIQVSDATSLLWQRQLRRQLRWQRRCLGGQSRAEGPVVKAASAITSQRSHIPRFEV